MLQATKVRWFITIPPTIIIRPQKAKQEISVQSMLKEVKLHNDIKSNLENIQVAKVRGIYFNQLSERDNFTLQFTLVIFTDKRRPIEIRRNHLGRR